MIRRPPRSTRTDTLFPTRRSSDLGVYQWLTKRPCYSRPGLAGFFQPMQRHRRPCRILPERFGWRSSRHAATCGEWLRSEEHTSELQSLMRISYAVFCLKKTNNTRSTIQTKRELTKHITTQNITKSVTSTS